MYSTYIHWKGTYQVQGSAKVFPNPELVNGKKYNQLEYSFGSPLFISRDWMTFAPGRMKMQQDQFWKLIYI